jgi:hypothetical protein
VAPLCTAAGEAGHNSSSYLVVRSRSRDLFTGAGVAIVVLAARPLKTRVVHVGSTESDGIRRNRRYTTGITRKMKI